MATTTMNRIKKLNRVLAVVAIIFTMLAAGHNFRLYSAHPLTNADLEDLNAPAQNTLETRSQQSEVPSHSPVIPSTTTTRAIDYQQQKRLTVTYGKLPLAFEVNRGQTDPQVKFLSRGNGYSLFLTSTEAVLALQKAKVRRTKALEPPFKKSGRPSGTDARDSDDQSVLRMKLIGSRNESRVVGIEELSGKSSYFRGKDPSRWHTQVTQYRKIKYESVYPGIDLVFYGNQRELEFDFIISPGADPDLIELTFAGAQDIYLGEAGHLVLQTAQGPLELKKPLVYQEVEGARKEITGSYILKSSSAASDSNGKSIGLQLASYDRSRSLIVDPVLSYATYLGGSGFDEGYDIAVDSIGNVYVTGVTASVDFPTVGAFQSDMFGDHDVFVAKISPAGDQLLYSTYLGGSTTDLGLAIAVDSVGNAYVTGETFSADFPTTLGAHDRTVAGFVDAFIAKLSPNGGSLLYSTYLGGSNAEGGSGVAVDSVGNAYVVGSTNSPDFPTTEGAFDRTCGTDANCDPYFPPGSHFCAPSPCEPWKAYDAFVVKVSPDGAALIYSTYLGGNSNDSASDIALDGQGNVYLTGSTTGSFPTLNPYQSNLAGGFVGDFCLSWPCPDIFITKLNPQGSALLYSTYLGGSGVESAGAIAIDPNGNAYVVGATYSPDFPVSTGAYQSTLNSHSNAFVAKLNSAGNVLINSTFLGGGFGENWGSGIALDNLGNIYVTGITQSPNFPTVMPINSTLRGGRDGFVTKFDASGKTILLLYIPRR